MAAVESTAPPMSHDDRTAMEQQLLDAVRRMPSKPQALFQLFASDRVPVLAKAAQESGHAFNAESLQLQLMEEFTKLPQSSLNDLKQRGSRQYDTTLSEVLGFVKKVRRKTYQPQVVKSGLRNFVMSNARMDCLMSGGYSIGASSVWYQLQVGSSYLNLCQGAQRAPHKELVPVIHLTLHGAEAARGVSGMYGMVASGDSAGTATKVGGAIAPQPAAPLKLPPEDLYVAVMCNNVTGRLHPLSCRVEANGKEMSATQFEQFAGCASAKKWRASLKVVPGSCSECPEGAAPMQVGRWFDMMGWTTGASRSKARKI